MTTTEDLASIAREVGGDRITVDSIARGYQDPHFVEAKPSFILKLQRADLLVVVGRELEIGWLPPLIQQSRNAKIQPGANGYLDASLQARILDIPTGPDHRAMGDVHPLGNPHYWLDPENGKVDRPRDRRQAVRAPARATRRISISGSPTSRTASTDAEKRWHGDDGAVQGHQGRHVPPLVYRTSPTASASTSSATSSRGRAFRRRPQHTLDLINEMKRQNVKIVLVEPYFDLKTPNAIGRQTGAQVLVLPPSVGGIKEITDYFKLFDYDINLLVDAHQAERGKVGLHGTGMIQFLAAPFVASLILTGIHAYLGRARRRARRHFRRPVAGADRRARRDDRAAAAVVWRRSARGRGLLGQPGVHVHRRVGLLAGSRPARRIPQEAIIGICYAVASAAAILAMSKATSESEHLKDMLVGNILAVSWPEVGKTALLYGAVGVFHYVFRAPVPRDLDGSETAEAEGLSVRFWDFLFYASFGFVVTSSVSIAGVLLVFCYLIVPSVAAMLYAERIGKRLAIGWSMGTVVSALGVYLSLVLDLPTGATIVCTFGLVLAIMAAVRPLVQPHRVVH